MESQASTPGPVNLFVSLRPRTQKLTLVLILLIVLDAISVVLEYSDITRLSRFPSVQRVPEMEDEAAIVAWALVALGYTVGYIITVVLFCMWIHRAHKNLASLRVTGLRFTPGWAVGWFFVPIMSLFKPYQAMAEIWRASDPDAAQVDTHRWQAGSTGLVLWGWWAFFLLHNWVANAVLRTTLRADTVGETIQSGWVSIVGDFLTIAAAAFAIVLIQTIDARQQEKRRRLGAARP